MNEAIVENVVPEEYEKKRTKIKWIFLVSSVLYAFFIPTALEKLAYMRAHMREETIYYFTHGFTVSVLWYPLMIQILILNWGWYLYGTQNYKWSWRVALALMWVWGIVFLQFLPYIIFYFFNFFVYF